MPEETKVEDTELDTNDADEKLIESVQAKLDIINGDVDDTDDADDTDGNVNDQQADDDKTDDDSTPEDKADDDTAGDDSTPDDKADKTDDKTDTDANDGDKTTKEVSLPDAYYRAAVHQGWEPDEIKEFFEADPEKALKTLAKIHESTNKITTEFARLGRVGLKSADSKVADDKKSDDTGVDIAAIKEQYGDDSAVVKAFEVMQSKLDTVRDSFPDKAIAQNDVNQQTDDPAVKVMVDKFFIDPALKPYVDFYGAGKDAAKLTQEQTGNRWSMLEMADNIILGSQAQGRNITAEEAMEMAHLLVSEPVREKALRVELSTKVKKRAKGVTLKPAKSKAAKADTDGKVTEKQLEERVQQKLNNVFR